MQRMTEVDEILDLGAFLVVYTSVDWVVESWPGFVVWKQCGEKCWEMNDWSVGKVANVWHRAMASVPKEFLFYDCLYALRKSNKVVHVTFERVVRAGYEPKPVTLTDVSAFQKSQQ